MRMGSDEPASYYGLIADRVCFAKDLSWFEFHINPRARWNDGVPLTADDVMFTIQKAKATIGVIQRRIDQAVERFERTGPQTVKVYLTQKHNPIPPTVLTGMQVLPRHYYEKHDLLATTLEPPVNSGPYRFGRLSPGRWMEFIRNRDYWAADLPVNKGRFNFDVIRHDFYRDQLVANQAFLAGNEDAKAESSASNWASEDRLPAFRDGEVKPGPDTLHAAGLVPGHDVQCPPAGAGQSPGAAGPHALLRLRMGQPRVARQSSRPAHQHLPQRGFRSPWLADAWRTQAARAVPCRLAAGAFTKALSLPTGGNWTNRRANLVKAAQLLREAGYKTVGGRLIDPRTGKPVVLRLLAYSALVDRQLSLFIENARRLGIEIRFRNVDTAQMRLMMRTYDYDILAPTRQLATSSTPGVGIIQMWSSKAADTPQQLNFPGVKNRAVDAMVTAVVKAKDHDSVVNAMRARSIAPCNGAIMSCRCSTSIPRRSAIFR